VPPPLLPAPSGEKTITGPEHVPPSPNYDYITLQQKYKLMETVKVTESVMILQE
jgi:hypothetical protein